MGYQNYGTIEELLEDSDATEFRAIVPEIPVTLSREELLEWAGPGWSGEYQEALDTFKRLAGAASDYDTVMARVCELQAAAQQARQRDQERTSQPGQHAPDQEQAPEPTQAVAEVTQAITVPAIEALREQYPDVAARFTPEQIQAAATAAAAASVNEPGL